MPPAGPAGPAGSLGAGTPQGPFTVRLPVFEGPFDLLLGLIGKHRLDITEVALATVTDEFLAYIRAQGTEWELGTATEFLVVAATLLDLKVARLLPGVVVADEEDLALLEARDLLFARLLQYRAYKEAATLLAGMMTMETRFHPRTVGLEDRYAGLVPEVSLGIGPEDLARLAVAALTAVHTPPVVGVEHVHVRKVSVPEQMTVVLDRLAARSPLPFRLLVGDCADVMQVVGRFLALLELYRQGRVSLAQQEALGELQVGLVATPAERESGDMPVPQEES